MGAYAQHLALLRQSEIKILEAMAAGANATQEFEIRGRRVRFSDLPDELRQVRKLISEYESLENGQSSSRPVRSKVRLTY